MNMNYYNDNDHFKADWLVELIRVGALPPGTVDQRSIAELKPGDLYERSHFFAGIGGWAHALELAGWPAARPVWTASLPCQPFSQAGKRRGTDDERHLWPVFRNLVEECRPSVIFGEQVASKDGRTWLATVFADLEELGYFVAASDLCAASIGAPHIRQRLFWCSIRMADSGGAGLAQRQEQSAWNQCQAIERSGDSGGLANNDGQRCPQRAQCGNWNNIIWIPCGDGKIRPLEPDLEPLVDGLPAGLVRGGNQRLAPQRTAEARTMRIMGYGDAIVPQLTALFVSTVLDYERYENAAGKNREMAGSTEGCRENEALSAHGQSC